MSRTIAVVSLAFAWVCANGAIWDAMQVLAWGKMFAGYAQTMPVSAALQETFNPDKPCELCVGVAKAKEDAEKNLPATTQQDAAKFVLALHTVDTPVFAMVQSERLTPSPMTRCERTDPVPLPPPRV